MKRIDRAYFRRRAAAERKLSCRAINADAARAHQALAIEYEDRLRSGYVGLMLVEDDLTPAFA